MSKQFAISARDHRAGVSQQSHDRMASRGRLPFIAGEATETKYDLGDFLLGGAVARSVESPQHPAQARALLPRQTGVRRHGAAVKGGEKAVDSLQPIEAIDAEGNDGGERFSAWNPVGQCDLSALALAKIVKRAHRLAIGPFGADDARRESAARIENFRRGRQDNDACIFGRRPEDGRLGKIEEWIDREIATPSAGG